MKPGTRLRVMVGSAVAGIPKYEHGTLIAIEDGAYPFSVRIDGDSWDSCWSADEIEEIDAN